MEVTLVRSILPASMRSNMRLSLSLSLSDTCYARPNAHLVAMVFKKSLLVDSYCSMHPVESSRTPFNIGAGRTDKPSGISENSEQRTDYF